MVILLQQILRGRAVQMKVMYYPLSNSDECIPFCYRCTRERAVE